MGIAVGAVQIGEPVEEMLAKRSISERESNAVKANTMEGSPQR